MTTGLPSNGSASDRLGGFLGRLHPVTQLLVVAAAVHLIATLVAAGFNLASPSVSLQSRPLGLRLAEHVRSICYSLALFGTPATVEFLFRIWNELRLGRRTA